jgi:hypothetical protein
MIANHPEIAPGIWGTVITFLSAIVAFCTAAIPVLQVLALVITCVAGVLTSVWTYKKLHAHNLEESAKLAAAAVKATAVVTAKALEETK